MAHSHPANIELTHQFNKVIKQGKSRKPFLDGFASRDRSTIYRDGDSLDKPIQIYRMWYRFLQLALELEEQKVQIITRMDKVELKIPKKDRWGKLRYSELRPVRQKVKVNRNAYAEWDLDIVPTTSFDDWWKGKAPKKKGMPKLKPDASPDSIKFLGGIKSHRQLFYPDRGVVLLNDKNDWVDDPNFCHVRIDKRRRINDVEKELRLLLAEQQRVSQSLSQFPIYGQPNINTLINRYNALILQLTTTLQDREILESDIFRRTRVTMGLDKDKSGEKAYHVGDWSPGRVMRDLVLPAKIALLSVCDGYFIKNPNKDYL